MKQSKIGYVALMASLWVLLPQPAAAFYNPSAGRWLSRDPIGEHGGANLYVTSGNNLVGFVDPYGLAWRVSRFGARQAAATCGCGDTWEDLARSIHMDVADYTAWANTHDPVPVAGKLYLIPNTIYLDKGNKKIYEGGPFDIIALLWEVADGLSREYRKEGYFVVNAGPGITAGDIIGHLEAYDIYVYGYFGHAGDGYINTSDIWGRSWGENVAPGRYSHYGLSKMLLLGCETVMDIDHTSPEGQSWTYVHTPWEANVAKRGVVVGFDRDVSWLDLIWYIGDPESLAVVYSGTNNKP